MFEVKQSFGNKMMCTAILGILSSGYKLPIDLITKSSCAIDVPEELRPYLIIKNSDNGWNNIDIFKDWLKRSCLTSRYQRTTGWYLFLTKQGCIPHKQLLLSWMNEKTYHIFSPLVVVHSCYNH